MSALKKPDAAASLWGFGAGTGFLGLVHVLPAVVNEWEAVLTFAAPAVTVVVSASWLWFGDALRRWKLETGVSRALKHRDAVLADGSSSNALKEKACANYEELVSILHELNCCETRQAGVSLSDQVQSRA